MLSRKVLGVLSSPIKNSFKSALQQKRFGGDWMKKNIWIEENSGLREASYKTWEFDSDSIPRLVAFFVIPAIIVYSWTEDEVAMRSMNAGLGVSKTGILPLPRVPANATGKEEE